MIGQNKTCIRPFRHSDLSTINVLFLFREIYIISMQKYQPKSRTNGTAMLIIQSTLPDELQAALPDKQTNKQTNKHVSGFTGPGQFQ